MGGLPLCLWFHLRLEDAVKCSAYSREDDEPEDGCKQPRSNARRCHVNVEEQDVHNNGPEDDESQRNVASDEQQHATYELQREDYNVVVRGEQQSGKLTGCTGRRC